MTMDKTNPPHICPENTGAVEEAKQIQLPPERSFYTNTFQQDVPYSLPLQIFCAQSTSEERNIPEPLNPKATDPVPIVNSE
ncbi:hypothetical protein AVEN_55222-1 [Araneus ventricosus]|uniref:Uncharacterized protein n=1 Tax=Araneus ventricosus TaxID=182803 RepID=A0A4Y2RRX1_ARAVE|nr:hypothetical protein AVEN_55222-1 [Araneus ventricosus]